MDAPPVINTPARRRPGSRIRIVSVILGVFGVLICVFAGWRGGVERQRFQTMLASVTPDQFVGITIGRDSASSTQLRDAASSAEFISALRELARYSPNHPQYRREKEMSVVFRLQDGREFSFRVCFSVDLQDRTAYIFGLGGTWKGSRLYEFLEGHHLI